MAAILQDVTDISSDDQLLRYAAAGQLARLLRRHIFLTQEAVAQGAGFGESKRYAGQQLSRALRNGLDSRRLLQLDEIISALAPDLDGTGGLSSLALRLSMERQDKIEAGRLTAHVPPSWTSKILQDPPADDIGVLIQASALLSAFWAAAKMHTAGQSVESVRLRYSKELELLVRRLVTISGAPPTARNYDAQVLLGMLAGYAFEPMRDWLEAELRFSPLGYRVWRAITKLVTLSEEEGNRADELRPWVRQLMHDSDQLRRQSLYAGRAHDLELAIAVPTAWSPPADDWAGEALRERAWNRAATIRERGTAAMGLWQRALRCDPATLAQVKDDLGRLIKEFRNPETRRDAPAGLRWVAATLESVIEKGQPVCNEWPDVGDPWLQHVQEAAGELDNLGIPDHLLTGTKSLFRHMILQNAGGYRAQAIETVVTSGWAEPVARALGLLLKKEPGEAWLRIRAEAALGLLQRPDHATEADLTNACLQAYRNLEIDKIPTDGRDKSQVSEDEQPPRARITEMHTSLFAVGDCFGVAGAEDHARTACERLREVLEGLAAPEMPRARILRRPARSATYLLTVTAQQPESGEKGLSQELLEKLSRHPDPVTRRLSGWALKVRFAPGGVRPLLAAAEEKLDTTPFFR
jgi:hypothetical protein